MKGSEVISALMRKFGVGTDKTLAAQIGMTVPGVRVWKNRTNVTGRQMAGLVYKAARAGVRATEANAIRPVVEFFRIECVPSRQGAGQIMFSVAEANGMGQRRYLEGLKAELESKTVVYIFFDSRGQAIYTGKARKQKLWKEMNLAFNRKRGEVQKIKRVMHPKRNQVFKTSKEKARQIKDQVVPLHELAAYFSAYEVSDGMINEVEAMLVR